MSLFSPTYPPTGILRHPLPLMTSHSGNALSKKCPGDLEKIQASPHELEIILSPTAHVWESSSFIFLHNFFIFFHISFIFSSYFFIFLSYSSYILYNSFIFLCTSFIPISPIYYGLELGKLPSFRAWKNFELLYMPL